MESPTIFEVIQEDTLRRTFRSAIQHVVKFVSNKFPHQFQNSSNQIGKDEAILIIELLVEWSFLYKWNASFTERFLGLQRYNDNPASSCGSLNHRQILSSLATITILPYVVKKLDAYYEHLQERIFVHEQQKSGDALSSVEQQFHEHYGRVKKLCDMLKIVLWVSFATGQNVLYPNVTFALLRNVRLGYTNVESLGDRTHASLSAVIGQRIATLISSGFSLSFKTGAFVIQLLDYWLGQTEVRQMLSSRHHTADIAFSPPVPRSSSKSGDNNRTLSQRLCPLCLQHRENPTTLACSGHVFCYRCISDFVTNHSKCPLTDFPASLSQLIRIYD